MNLYLRVLWMFLWVRWRSKLSLLNEYRSQHIVWPTDLDLLGHMNNGRYFTVTDIVRVELLVRSGVWKAMRKRRLYPVIAAESIQFRKSLKPFRRYEIRTRLLGWDDRFFYVEHRFTRSGTDHALAVLKVAIVGASRPKPVEVLREVYPDLPPTRMPSVVEQWNRSTKIANR